MGVWRLQVAMDCCYFGGKYGAAGLRWTVATSDDTHTHGPPGAPMGPLGPPGAPWAPWGPYEHDRYCYEVIVNDSGSGVGPWAQGHGPYCPPLGPIEVITDVRFLPQGPHGAQGGPGGHDKWAGGMVLASYLHPECQSSPRMSKLVEPPMSK